MHTYTFKQALERTHADIFQRPISVNTSKVLMYIQAFIISFLFKIDFV